MMDLIKILATLLLFGLIIYASYKTIAYAQRNLRSLIQSKGTLLMMRIALLIIGAIAGFGLSSFTWRVSPNHVIVGLPVPWAIWENVNGRWEDFLNPLSIVPWCIDLVCGLALLHLPVTIACVVRKRKFGPVTPGAI